MEKNLNPNVPQDAVEVIDVLTQNVNLNLSRAEVGKFNQAVYTLHFYFQNKQNTQEKPEKEKVKNPVKRKVRDTNNKPLLKQEP